MWFLLRELTHPGLSYNRVRDKGLKSEPGHPHPVIERAAVSPAHHWSPGSNRRRELRSAKPNRMLNVMVPPVAVTTDVTATVTPTEIDQNTNRARVDMVNQSPADLIVVVPTLEQPSTPDVEEERHGDQGADRVAEVLRHPCPGHVTAERQREQHLIHSQQLSPPPRPVGERIEHDMADRTDRHAHERYCCARSSPDEHPIGVEPERPRIGHVAEQAQGHTPTHQPAHQVANESRTPTGPAGNGRPTRRSGSRGPGRRADAHRGGIGARRPLEFDGSTTAWCAGNVNGTSERLVKTWCVVTTSDEHNTSRLTENLQIPVRLLAQISALTPAILTVRSEEPRVRHAHTHPTEIRSCSSSRPN